MRDAVVRVDPLGGQPLAESRKASRAGGPIGLLPAGPVGLGGRRGEVGGRRVLASVHDGHWYFFWFASCSWYVFAKAWVFDPSPFATKKR